MEPSIKPTLQALLPSQSHLISFYKYTRLPDSEAHQKLIEQKKKEIQELEGFLGPISKLSDKVKMPKRAQEQWEKKELEKRETRKKEFLKKKGERVKQFCHSCGGEKICLREYSFYAGDSAAVNWTYICNDSKCGMLEEYDYQDS